MHLNLWLCLMSISGTLRLWRGSLSFKSISTTVRLSQSFLTAESTSASGLASHPRLGSCVFIKVLYLIILIRLAAVLTVDSVRCLLVVFCAVHFSMVLSRGASRVFAYVVGAGGRRTSVGHFASIFMRVSSHWRAFFE